MSPVEKSRGHTKMSGSLRWLIMWVSNMRGSDSYPARRGWISTVPLRCRSLQLTDRAGDDGLGSPRHSAISCCRILDQATGLLACSDDIEHVTGCRRQARIRQDLKNLRVVETRDGAAHRVASFLTVGMMIPCSRSTFLNDFTRRRCFLAAPPEGAERTQGVHPASLLPGELSRPSWLMALLTFDCEQSNFVARLLCVIFTRACSSWWVTMWSRMSRQIVDRLNFRMLSWVAWEALRCWPS